MTTEWRKQIDAVTTQRAATRREAMLNWAKTCITSAADTGQRSVRVIAPEFLGVTPEDLQAMRDFFSRHEIAAKVTALHCGNPIEIQVIASW